MKSSKIFYYANQGPTGSRACRGLGGMGVGFTTTYAISAYHH